MRWLTLKELLVFMSVLPFSLQDKDIFENFRPIDGNPVELNSFFKSCSKYKDAFKMIRKAAATAKVMKRGVHKNELEDDIYDSIDSDKELREDNSYQEDSRDKRHYDQGNRPRNDIYPHIYKHYKENNYIDKLIDTEKSRFRRELADLGIHPQNGAEVTKLEEGKYPGSILKKKESDKGDNNININSPSGKTDIKKGNMILQMFQNVGSFLTKNENMKNTALTNSPVEEVGKVVPSDDLFPKRNIPDTKQGDEKNSEKNTDTSNSLNRRKKDIHSSFKKADREMEESKDKKRNTKIDIIEDGNVVSKFVALNENKDSKISLDLGNSRYKGTKENEALNENKNSEIKGNSPNKVSKENLASNRIDVDVENKGAQSSDLGNSMGDKLKENVALDSKYDLNLGNKDSKLTLDFGVDKLIENIALNENKDSKFNPDLESSLNDEFKEKVATRKGIKDSQLRDDLGKDKLQDNIGLLENTDLGNHYYKLEEDSGISGIKNLGKSYNNDFQGNAVLHENEDVNSNFRTSVDNKLKELDDLPVLHKTIDNADSELIQDISRKHHDQENDDFEKVKSIEMDETNKNEADENVGNEVMDRRYSNDYDLPANIDKFNRNLDNLRIYKKKVFRRSNVDPRVLYVYQPFRKSHNYRRVIYHPYLTRYRYYHKEIPLPNRIVDIGINPRIDEKVPKFRKDNEPYVDGNQIVIPFWKNPNHPARSKSYSEQNYPNLDQYGGNEAKLTKGRKRRSVQNTLAGSKASSTYFVPSFRNRNLMCVNHTAKAKLSKRYHQKNRGLVQIDHKRKRNQTEPRRYMHAIRRMAHSLDEDGLEKYPNRTGENYGSNEAANCTDMAKNIITLMENSNIKKKAIRNIHQHSGTYSPKIISTTNKNKNDEYSHIVKLVNVNKKALLKRKKEEHSTNNSAKSEHFIREIIVGPKNVYTQHDLRIPTYNDAESSGNRNIDKDDLENLSIGKIQEFFNFHHSIDPNMMELIKNKYRELSERPPQKYLESRINVSNSILDNSDNFTTPQFRSRHLLSLVNNFTKNNREKRDISDGAALPNGFDYEDDASRNSDNIAKRSEKDYMEEPDLTPLKKFEKHTKIKFVNPPIHPLRDFSDDYEYEEVPKDHSNIDNTETKDDNTQLGSPPLSHNVKKSIFFGGRKGKNKQKKSRKKHKKKKKGHRSISEDSIDKEYSNKKNRGDEEELLVRLHDEHHKEAPLNEDNAASIPNNGKDHKGIVLAKDEHQQIPISNDKLTENAMKLDDYVRKNFLKKQADKEKYDEDRIGRALDADTDEIESELRFNEQKVDQLGSKSDAKAHEESLVSNLDKKNILEALDKLAEKQNNKVGEKEGTKTVHNVQKKYVEDVSDAKAELSDDAGIVHCPTCPEDMDAQQETGGDLYRKKHPNEVVDLHFAKDIVDQVMQKVSQNNNLKIKIGNALNKKRVYETEGVDPTNIFKTRTRRRGHCSEEYAEAKKLLCSMSDVLNKLVGQEIEQKLCEKLPECLKIFLEHMVNPPKYTRSERHDDTYHQDSFLFKTTAEKTAQLDSSSKDQLESILLQLLDKYNKLDEISREKAAPLKCYIDKHLDMLNSLSSSSSEVHQPVQSVQHDSEPVPVAQVHSANEEELVQKDLENLGLGNKHSFQPSFNLDKLVHAKSAPAAFSNEKNQRVEKREAKESKKVSEKYKKLVKAAEQVRDKRENEQIIGQLYGNKKIDTPINKVHVPSNSDNSEINKVAFESPVVFRNIE